LEQLMDISQLFEVQKSLDARIIKEKGLEGKDLLPNTVLALQVEIGELANNWRGFKYWSNDKEPRTRIEHCLGCSGNEAIAEKCDLCDGENPLLVEYVDCLHLLLSIANQLGLPADDLYVAEDELEYETSVVFTELLHNVGLINGHHILLNPPKDIPQWQREHLRGALYIFYNLGEQRLGFTFEQIATAYLEKNQVNHARQSSGY
jgi:dimeric dUTPase (all-alpha-NTP-PPase superfamily)